MGKDWEMEMSLGELISKMGKGLNTFNGSDPRVGGLLRDVFQGRDDDLATWVTVTRYTDSWGYGPSAGAQRRWRIKGLESPVKFAHTGPDVTDVLFGHAGSFPSLLRHPEGGFEVTAPF